MKSDKAVTMACPFVGRKCQAQKCMAWAEGNVDLEGFCIIITDMLNRGTEMDGNVENTTTTS